VSECVQAAARLCDAEVRGGAVSSTELEFRPGYPAREVTGPRELTIDIGTQGAALLVVQTVIVPAVVAGHPLRLAVTGGTHNPFAPPFDFVDRVFLPHLRAMGAAVTLTLDAHGFATGDSKHAPGRVVLEVGTSSPLAPLELVDAGSITARRATAVIMRLPTHVADRELEAVRERLGWSTAECTTRELTGGAAANLLLLEVQRTTGAELVTVHGERGLRAETVADRACTELATYLAAAVPVGEHLADQLLLPLAIAGGGRFRTLPLSLHATTNLETIRHFLDVSFTVTDSLVTIS
jgi:RNA 3'-terminal phosphate cyclase (ATP)